MTPKRKAGMVKGEIEGTKKKQELFASLLPFRSASRIRTYNPLVNSQMLYR